MPLNATLNPNSPIEPHLVFDTHQFEHPVFHHAAVAAQPRLQTMQGRRNTWICGAHLRNGCHEDGLASAVRVARLLGAETPWRRRSLPSRNRRLCTTWQALSRRWVRPWPAQKRREASRPFGVARYNAWSVTGALRHPALVRTPR